MDPNMDLESSTMVWDWDLDPGGQVVDLSGCILPIDWQQPLLPWTESTHLRPDHGAHIVPSDPSNVQGWDTISTDAMEVDRVLSQVVFPLPLPKSVT